MRWLTDRTIEHLRRVADWPDLNGTKYDVIEKIAQGGMASVYLARDRDLDRLVAVKVLSGAVADAQAADRMLKEARIVARLEHPSIVPVHDSGVLPDGRIYYTMKLVRGHRLDDYPKQAQSLTDRLRVFEKICDAVSFAHAHGVIHRDLKPENIMVGSFGEVLVMDWGVAKVAAGLLTPSHSAGPGKPTAAVLASPPTATAHGTVIGTPGYMSPEQASGEVDLIDGRTDVFALGAILSFLVTTPFDQTVSTASDPGGHKETQTAVPKPGAITRHRPAVPRPLDAICQKAQAPSRDDRYQTVTDLSHEIARYLAGLRVDAYPEGLFGTLKRLAVKYQTLILLVLAYLTMRILLIFFAGT